MTARPTRWATSRRLAMLSIPLPCLVAALALLWAPRAGATSPGANGKIAYVGDSDTDRGIALMSPNGRDKTVLVANSPSPVPPSYFAPVWSPDGRRIVFNGTTRYGDIWLEVMNADGSGVHRVGSGEIPQVDQWPDWSPDSEMIAFASWQGSIWVVSGDGGGATKLTGPGRNDQPAWSPDGQRIAFTSWRDGNYEIYVMNADGSGEIRLTDDPEEDSGPVWSPDGRRIAFTSSRDGNYEIYGMNADGSDETRLTENSMDDGGPVWSPDGRRIAFTADATNVSGAVHVMNSDGSAMANLTASFEKAWDPDWSPDGRQIAFTGQRAGVRDVYVMNPDGSCQTDLAAGSQPDWQSLAGAGLPPPSCETAAPSQTVAANQTPPPPNSDFGFGKLRRNKQRGTGRLTVRIPGPGELALRGRKLKSGSKEPAAGGEVRLALKPRGKAKRRLSKRRLEETGKAIVKQKVRARVTFIPRGGAPNTKMKRMKLVRHR